MLVTNAEDSLGSQLADEASEAAEIWMVSAYVSPAGLDALNLVDLAREKPVHLVVGRAGEEGLTSATRRALERLAKNAYADGGVRVASPPSHAKLYAFRSHQGGISAYIGSSNLSLHGLQDWREANLPLFGEPAEAVLEEIRNAWELGISLQQANLPVHQKRQPSTAGDRPQASEQDTIVSLPAGADGEELPGLSLTLLDRTGEVQEKHGLNWGWAKERAPGQPRNPNEACIPLRSRHIDQAEKVFGSAAPGTEFHAVMDDGTEMRMQVEGSRTLKGHSGKIAKQIASTPEKSDFGRWILRDKLGIPEGRPARREDLDKYGRSNIAFYLLSENEPGQRRTVYVDFAVPQIQSDGRAWSPAEVQEAVRAYFAMLEAEEGGRDYTKAEHRRRVARRLADRSEGAVEYKFQNISAVLNEIGYRWLEGYKPAANYQQLLKEAVTRELRDRPGLRTRLQK